MNRSNISWWHLLVLTHVAAAFICGPAVQVGAATEVPVDPNIFVNLSKKMIPSVVNISSVMTVKSPFTQGGPDDVLRKFFGDLFKRYPGGRGPDDGDGLEGGELEGGLGGSGDDERGRLLPPQSVTRMPKAVSLGTGFIIDSSGLILTNNHVVTDADEIKISFTESPDEKPSDAKVVGRDPDIDVALIKVETSRELKPVSFGDSDALEVGEYVMTVGNPFGQGHSVTHGIISAKGRLAPDFPLANYIQTDAPINPGNSGGPLINLKGEVIGINNAIDQRAQGIGFAIPINLVKKVLPELRTKGVVARGYIGVLVDPLSPEVAKKMKIPMEKNSPIVTYVYPKDPADQAGLKPYDLILEFNKVEIHSRADLVAAVTAVAVKDKVPVKIFRNGGEKVLTIQVGQRPGTQIPFHKSNPTQEKSKKQAAVNSGMVIENLNPEITRELGLSEKVKGVVVSNLAYGGPADKAGLARGDVILEVDRKSVPNEEAFYSLVKEKKSYLLRVRRVDAQGQEVFLVLLLDLSLTH